MKKHTIFRKWGVILLAILLCFTLSGCNHLSSLFDGTYESNEAKTYNETVDAFFAAVDGRDKEAIKKLFAPSVLKENPDIDKDIDQLFAFYSGPTERCERDGSMAAGSYTNNYGDKTAEVYDWFAVVSGGTNYYCLLDLMYENDLNKDEIGIKHVNFVSEKVKCSEDFSWSTDSGITVIEDATGNYETRRIGGYPNIYVPIDRIPLKEEDILAFLSKSNSFNEFKAQFGEPNAETSTLWEYAYELDDVDGEKRYATIHVESVDNDLKNKTIYKVTIENGISKTYLKVLWEKE